MLNPILAFSATRRMRSFRTLLIVAAYLGVMLGTVLLMMGSLFKDTVSIFALRTSVRCYAMLMIAQFALIVLIAPAMTSGAVAGERERQTLELLLVTNTRSFRIVAGKAAGQVLEQGHGMDEPLLQSKRVDEGLEGGSWRAAGQGAVDLPRDGAAGKVGGASEGAHLHGGPVHEHGRGIGEAARAVAAREAPEGALQKFLLGRVNGRCHHVGKILGQQKLACQVRAGKGQVARAVDAERRRFPGAVPCLQQSRRGVEEVTVGA